jgi:hypothetical protein
MPCDSRQKSKFPALSPGHWALKEILSGLRNSDPRLQLDRHCRLPRGGELLAQLDLSRAGDELFEAEVGELQELARQGGADGAAVARRLESVTAVLAVGVP